MKSNIVFFLFFLIQQTKINCQEGAASNLKILNICAGQTKIIDCTSSTNLQTIVIEESFYGIQNPSSSTCGYTQNDCFEEVKINKCLYNNPKCSLQAIKKQLSNCGSKTAGYLHVKYYCVPYLLSSNSSTVDICANKSPVTFPKGFLTSPSYPSFNIQSSTCINAISVPNGKSINLWAVDMFINGRDTLGNCPNDFVEIKDTSGTYDLCSNDRNSYYKTFCSNLIYISYKALTKQQGSNYRGFKLYYEINDAPPFNCQSGTPSYPTESPFLTTSPMKIEDFEASQYFNFYICKTDSPYTIQAPAYFIVYVEKMINAVPSSLTCEIYNSKHCSMEAKIACNFRPMCTFKAPSYQVSACGNQRAQYTYGTYRFIPIESPNKYSMCDSADINTDINPHGILISRKYPIWESFVDCTRRIVSSDPNKAFKFYITDIDIEDENYFTQECENGYVSLSDGIINEEKFCAIIDYASTYTFKSCSNILTVKYKSSNGGGIPSQLRGFRAYYELIDLPTECPNYKPTTTTPSLLTTKPLSGDVFSNVLANDENGKTVSCSFPFKYKGNTYKSCINLDQPDYWCSLTPDFDKDNKKGVCHLGLTNNVKFEVCAQKSRNFFCPAGYVINLVAAEFVRTSDGSCDYSKKICSQSAFNYLQNFVSGKNSSPHFATSPPLQSCSNLPLHLSHIDYRCIPESVNFLKTFEFCSYSSSGVLMSNLTDNYGIIQTPSYPKSTNKLNCSLYFNTNEIMHIKIFALYVKLDNKPLNQPCTDYYFQVNDEKKICKSPSAVLIHESCSNKFNVKMIMGGNFYTGVKLFYEVKKINDISVCPETTLSTQSGLTTASTPSQEIPVFVQQGIASETKVFELCIGTRKFSCPNNYTIVIRNQFLGVSTNNVCGYTEKDCVSYQDIEKSRCSGRQSCEITHFVQKLPECQKYNNYLRIEYDCVPDMYPKKTICPQEGQIIYQTRGALANPSYPNFDENLNCKAKIIVDQNSLIKLYIKDLSIDTDDDCSTEYLSVTGSNSLNLTRCDELNSVFLVETCSNTIELNFVTKKQNQNQNKRGISIYYEEIEKPFDFICDAQIGTTRLSTTLTTTRSTTTTSRSTSTTKAPEKPSYFGFASSLYTLSSCGQEKISCPANYIIIIIRSVYGVRKDQSSSSCIIDENDCQGDNINVNNLCSGYQNCDIKFTPNITIVSDCKNKRANYYYLAYRCVPTSQAGLPTQSKNVELCSSTSTSAELMVSVNSSSIFQSPNYPLYTSFPITCKKNITIETGNHIQVYLNAARFQGSSDCNQNDDDFLKITDGFETRKICGGPNYPRYLMQSRSNWIQVEFSTSSLFLPSSFYKGFQLYLQAHTDQKTTVSYITTPSRKPDVTSSYRPGFASPFYHTEICSNSETTLVCPANYGIIVHNEHLFSTKNGCNHGEQDCKEPTNMIELDCAGKQICNTYFPETEMALCSSQYADFIDFDYQCVPAKPSSDVSAVYTCKISGEEVIEGASNGFVQSPGYPVYQTDIKFCSVLIKTPPGYGVKMYLMDLSLSNIDFDGDKCVSDYLILNDNQFCSTSPSRFVLSSYSNSSTVVFSSVTHQQLIETGESPRGFLLYFETFSLSDTTIPTESTKYTKSSTIAPDFAVTAILNANRSSNLDKVSLGLGIPIILIMICLVLFIYKFHGSIMNQKMSIKYSKKNNDDLQSFANPNIEHSLYD